MAEVLEPEAVESVDELELTHALKSHKNIHTNHNYRLLELAKDWAKISINPRKSETVDKESQLYDGSIFSAATFCAMAAVNQERTFLISANVDFLNTVDKTDEEMIFEATASSNISGKKQIEVVGKINDIAVFSGNFVAMKLDTKSLIKNDKQTKEDQS